MKKSRKIQRGSRGVQGGFKEDPSTKESKWVQEGINQGSTNFNRSQDLQGGFKGCQKSNQRKKNEDSIEGHTIRFQGWACKADFKRDPRSIERGGFNADSRGTQKGFKKRQKGNQGGPKDDAKRSPISVRSRGENRNIRTP